MSNNLQFSFAINGIFIADLLSKLWAIETLKDSAPITLLPVLRLIYVENTGVAFGIFANSGDIGRWLLIVLALALSGLLIYFLRQSQSKVEKWACALMLAGALGNMVDRIRLGYVVDFIDAHWMAYHWPAFNIADISICCGGALFAYSLFLGNNSK